MSAKSKAVDPVSDDRNWRSLIMNETNCALRWQDDWGFMSAVGTEEKNPSLEEQIHRLEGKLADMSDARFRTTQGDYGRYEDIEKYPEARYNAKKNPELKACDRKPKKK
jgi:hypothetical protein